MGAEHQRDSLDNTWHIGIKKKKKKKVRGVAKQWYTQELGWGLVSERLKKKK